MRNFIRFQLHESILLNGGLHSIQLILNNWHIMIHYDCYDS